MMRTFPGLFFAMLLLLVAGCVSASAQQAIDITRYGAVGDGVRDDGGAIQAAIDAAPAGATIRLPKGKAGTYRVARTLTVNKALHFKGTAGVTIRQVRPGIPLFAVRASSVSFDGLRLAGVQTAKWVLEENAIDASGTFRTGLAPMYIRDLKITNCIIDRFGNAAIKLLYVDGVTIAGNTVTDAVEVGIGLLSVRNATVSRNTVRGVSGVDVTGRNAYGIYASRLSTDAGELVSQPRSQGITISDNRVSDVPTWTGIDTHGGSDVTMTRNRVRNVLFGFAVGTSSNRARRQAYAPKNVIVEDNIAESGVADGSRQYGITFTGVAGGSDFATGVVRNNTIIGFGQSSSAIVPAVNIGATQDLEVSGNIIEAPGTVGIYAVGPNRGLRLVRNVITDPWTNDGKIGAAMGIRIDGDANGVVIRGNSILQKGKAAKFTLAGDTGYGVYMGPGRGNFGRIGGNINQARRTVEDANRSLVSE
jgi:hypothetical protein